MKKPNLIAGLDNKGVEIFLSDDDSLKAIYDRKVQHFDMLPSKLHDAFISHMMANKRALTSLKHDFHLTDVNDMLIQYMKCNFGNLDLEADMHEDGTINPKCWDCGLRGTCPGEGKVCGRIQGPNGMLTKRETEVFFLLIDGKIDKEIATHFESSLATVETQLTNIRTKLQCNNRIEVMNFAVKRKLISI
jgi:DNA-binding CsgD family transcriptional regulator